MINGHKLRVVIVGSGLAGLTAARILREHHDVTVYERGSEEVATGGQGIMIAPNGVKILDRIGYDHGRAAAVPIYGIRTYKNGNVLEDVGMNLKSWFGADSLAQKRSDFRDELMRLATAPSSELGILGDPAKIVFDTAATGLNPDEGIVTLSDGSTIIADVVVAADGIHSRLRNIVVGSEDYFAKKTGLTCYRVAVATEDAKKELGDLPPPHWWEPNTYQNRSSVIYASDDSPRFITAYPIRNGSYFNLSCILKTQESSTSTTESWNANGDHAKLIELFGDFSESIRRILSAAKEVKVWELQDLELLPTWTRGRTMLIGDAAHAMTPMQGQGANLSIEDAESLRLLAPGTRREEVEDILKLAESIRRPRTAHILAETRKSHANMKVAERLTKNLDFNCGYDGIYAALEARDGVLGS
ncbi:FAD binding domain protein [Lojkania enalia]|uniref:FAD binding domain protein n=1 Tax=Lojkania enalia TaxID=147567 RepID=A0A9P4N8B5_9PLEO|nr:FAD binding domain protein [Didymosphaeria enalia]